MRSTAARAALMASTPEACTGMTVGVAPRGGQMSTCQRSPCLIGEWTSSVKPRCSIICITFRSACRDATPIAGRCRDARRHRPPAGVDRESSRIWEWHGWALSVTLQPKRQRPGERSGHPDNRSRVPAHSAMPEDRRAIGMWRKGPPMAIRPRGLCCGDRIALPCAAGAVCGSRDVVAAGGAQTQEIRADGLDL